MTHLFRRKLTGFILLTAILLSNISAFAQKTKRGSAAPSKSQVASSQSKEGKTCSSGYNGSVKYTKTVQTSSSGRYGSYADTKRVYQLNVQIRDDGRQLGSVSTGENGLSGSFNLYGSASATETENFSTLDVSEKDDFCKLTLKGAQDKTRVHCESKFTRQSDSSGTAPDTNVYIGLRGEKMSLGFSSLPKLSGTSNEISSSKCSGTCSPDKPVNSSRSGEIKNGGASSVATDDDADIKFNPKSFNRLSGSWSDTEQTPGGTVTENFQWNLSRCSPPLEIDNIRFEHRQVMSPNNWIGVDPLSGTYDGNLVKIKATVYNNGGDTAYASVKFSELKSGENLPDATVSVRVDPGESRDVEYEWDTNGYAWNENQTKETEREIKAEIEGDAKTEKIKILPKPVILAHGLWSNAAAWAQWHAYLREAHSFAWEAFPVGEDPNHGKMNTGDHAFNYDPTNSIFQNAQELGKQIKWVREQKNAWHVDLVVHSMGGLISRFYIHNFMAPVFDNKPEVTHLVMLGTPNQGSACADLMYGVYNSRVFEKPVEALRQLKPSVVEEYNRKTYNRKNVKFSILAGFGAGPTCGLEIGDGVVPLSSALYNIVDRDYAGTHHLALTDEKYFKSFVFPRLAIGPKKAKAEQTNASLDQLFDDNYALAFENGAQNKNADYFRRVGYKTEEKPQTDDDIAANKDPENLTTRQGIKIAPRQTVELDIPVRGGTSAGVVMVALAYISATLTDENGAVVGASPVNTGGLLNYFRTITVQKEIKNGTWKLKLENTANVEATVLVAGFTNSGANSSFAIEAGKSSPDGTVSLTAKITENNAPVLNAKITATIVGQMQRVEFFDDGRHGDGAANDGVYGAATEKLPKGEYFVEAQAEANDRTRNAVAMITVGGANPAAKTAAKPRRKS